MFQPPCLTELPVFVEFTYKRITFFLESSVDCITAGALRAQISTVLSHTLTDMI